MANTRKSFTRLLRRTLERMNMKKSLIYVNAINFNNFFIKSNKFGYILYLIIYKLSLDILYGYVISPFYLSEGLVYQPILYKYLISSALLIFILPHIVNLYNIKEPSALIVLLINLVYFIPGCTFYALAGIDDTYFGFYSIYWILLMWLYYKTPKMSIKFINKNDTTVIFNSIILIVIFGTIIITGVFNKFHLNFSLWNVYDLRKEVVEMKLPSFIEYFTPLSAAIVPIAVVYYLIKKNLIMATLLIFVQALLFSFGGHKTTFFMIFVAIIAFHFYKKESIKLIVPILIALNIISIFERYYRDNFSYISAFLQRRNMFTTNVLSVQYFDYFSSNEPDFLRQSVLRLIGQQSIYDIPIPHLIAQVYSGRDFGANNGMCGDAIANFGWFGVILYPVLLTLIFRIFDLCTKGIESKILITVSVSIVINLTNSSFFTVLLTHAYLLTCVTLYFYPRNKNINFDKFRWSKM